GTELSEEGSKEVDRFDFGFVKIPETRHDWITQKLDNPRIFDEGKVKTADEKLKMPLFHFSPEERSAVVTAVLSFTKEKPILSSTRLLGARDKALEAGRRIVFEHNCQGGHNLEEADKLLHYFSALTESPFPFETPPVHPPVSTEIAAAKRLVSRDYLNCFSCHQQGARKPEGPPEGWAPDLALARERLRPDWIVK